MHFASALLQEPHTSWRVAFRILDVHEHARRYLVSNCWPAVTTFRADNPSSYIPLFFESAHAQSATKAGLSLLPFMLGVVFAAGIGGAVVSYTGRYWYFLVLGGVPTAIGQPYFDYVIGRD